MDSKNKEKSSLLEITDDKESAPKATLLLKSTSMVCVLIFVCLDVGSTTCVTLLERRIPDFELNTIRTSGCLIACVLLFVSKRELPWIPRSEIGHVIAYGMSNVISVMAIFSSVTFIPISSMSCVRETLSIFSGLILFRIFLKETIATQRVIFAMLCMVGVVLVIQPRFMFPVSNKVVELSPPHYNSQSLMVIGYVLAFLAGVSNTCGTLVGKKYSYIPNNYTSVTFWAAFIGFFSSAIAMLIFETPTTPRDWYDILLITGHTISFILSFPAFILAYKHITANTCIIIMSTNVVLALIPQYTVLSSILPGHRNWIEVLGVVLVLVGCAMGSVIELLTII